MAKTMWQPLVLGLVFGLLAGIASITGFLFIVPDADTDNAAGFYMTLLLPAAALAFAALPARYTRPVWYEPKRTSEQDG